MLVAVYNNNPLIYENNKYGFISPYKSSTIKVDNLLK